MNLQIKKLGSADMKHFKELLLLFEDVFEMDDFNMPDQGYLQQLMEKNDFFVFVALKEGKVLGGLTAYSLPQYYSELPVVYIYDLAVKTEFQRKGIGKQLISGINNFCKEIGVEEVFVQADEEDDYAVDFYQSTGGIPEKAVHFSYPLNPKTHKPKF